MSSEAPAEYSDIYRLPNDLADALDRSENELLQLAAYFHQIGKQEKAQEIYETILKANKRREAIKAREEKARSERAASA